MVSLYGLAAVMKITILTSCHYCLSPVQLQKYSRSMMLSILAQKASYVQQLAETAFFEDLLHREMYVYLGKEKKQEKYGLFPEIPFSRLDSQLVFLMLYVRNET